MKLNFKKLIINFSMYLLILLIVVIIGFLYMLYVAFGI
jgi:hypothetical protein